MFLYMHCILYTGTSLQHIKAARLVRKTNEKVKDVEVLQRANWNNIEYIYIRERLLLGCIRSLREQKSID